METSETEKTKNTPETAAKIDEIQITSGIMEKIAGDKRVFSVLLEAHEKEDAATFQSELMKYGFLEYCEWVCHWICSKRHVAICELLCPAIEKKPIEIEEMRSFAKEFVRLTKDKEQLSQVLLAFEKKDAAVFQKLLERNRLTPYCRQICSWISSIRCRRACKILCRRPYITHVGFIPTTQINSEGYANGPSDPPGTTPSPTSCCGDHPFGNIGDPGTTNIRGTFNTPNADKYKVEWASDPIAGTWTPITLPITEWDFSGWIPIKRTRYPSVLPEPGWYTVAEMIDKLYLTNWDTRQATNATGKFYLRLVVKNSFGASIQSPIVPVRVDNENPNIPQLDLFIKKPDGTEQAVKCGGIKKGEGTLLIKFICKDENFRQLTLTAEGGCGINVPIIDEKTGTQVSRCYGGDITDHGETALRVVEWNPWKDPQIIPCCYNVVLRIWDRAILNNYYSGGHGNSDNEAVQIALG